MSTCLVVPRQSQYIKCMIEKDCVDLFTQKSPIISLQSYLTNKSVEHKFRKVLESAMKSQLQYRIGRLKKELMSKSPALQKTYKQAICQKHHQDCNIRDPVRVICDPVALQKMLETTCLPYFSEMSLYATLQQRYKKLVSLSQSWTQFFSTNYKKLKQLFLTAYNTFAGRRPIVEEMFSLVLSFAYNQPVFQNANLNFIIIGKKGSGKTMITQFIKNVLVHSGIVHPTHSIQSNKDQHVFRLDEFIGASKEESVKNISKFFEHSVGDVIIMDNASVSNLKTWKKYGSSVCGTIRSALQRYRGDNAYILSGTSTDIKDIVLRSCKELSSLFPYMFILRDLSSKDILSLLKAFLYDKHKLKSPISDHAYEYLYELLTKEQSIAQNHSKHRIKSSALKNSAFKTILFPHGARDIEKLSDFISEYVKKYPTTSTSYKISTEDLKTIISIYMKAVHHTVLALS